MGFRTGDRILKMDDYTPERFEMLTADLVRKSVKKVTVLRDGDTTDVYIDQSMIKDVLNSQGIFDLAMPLIVDSIMTTSPNYESGLMKGDRITAIDGQPAEFFQDSRKLLDQNRGQDINVTVIRDKDTLQIPVQVDTNGFLGVYPARTDKVKTRTYSLVSAIPAGVRHTFNTIGGYIQDLKLVFTPSTEAYKSVGSFIAMGQIFPSAWNWYAFLNILALLSIMLGVMNLIPIPALDGGHILFTLYEIITGKKPSDKFLTAAQIIGMVLLIGLMVLAFGNDISRLIR